MNPILEVRGVSYHYPGGFRGVNNVSLRLYPGDSLSLIGPSGAGKSTLLHIMAGLLEPEEGEVVLKDGVRASIVMQDYQSQIIYPTVYEELAYTLKHSVGRVANLDDLIWETAKSLKLENIVGRQTFKLSAGEKKRLAVALMLIGKPHILLLDEPLSDADRITEEILTNHIKEVKKQGAVVTATNDLSVALEFSEKAILMVGGRVVKEYENVKEALREAEELRSLGIRVPRSLCSSEAYTV